ncbi:hypothetical protein GJ744_008190 [Endocarpon pusillum]|uniref:Uncharacterized protein n=1 Tax=Endocarpon pusillum TaxID=364733 RepID=A0A8H7ALJ3_9EURO|nr:hypothetical protein GJ744_008190 [Endocarpon pusillum]
MVDVGCLNAKDKKSLTDAGYKFEGKFWMPYSASNYSASGNIPLNAEARAGVRRWSVSPNCVYQLLDINARSISSFIDDFLNGTVFSGTYVYNYQSEIQLQAIFNEGNVTFERINETWKNISDAITLYMRQNGDTNKSAPARGEAFHTQTCVHIRWLFLLYPAVLVLLAIIFFIVMVFETRHREISRHDWKSSPLALLFHGLDRLSMGNGEYASVTQASEMERIADHTPVRLAQTSYGWQFSKMGVER